MMDKYDLRSSSFAKYCFGKALASYFPKREEQLILDKKGEEKPIEGWYLEKAIAIGNKHEKHGIAKWCRLNNKIPRFILGEQKSRTVKNWMNLTSEDTVSLSTTPDGIYGNCLLEVKTTKHAKECFPSFPKQYLPQIYGQQMVMNMWYGQEELPMRIERTHLINFSRPKGYTKIWEVTYNQEFINFLVLLLEEYSNKLLQFSDKPLNEKPKFDGNVDENIKLIWEG